MGVFDVIGDVAGLFIRILLAIAIVSFCLYFLMLPLFHTFLPMLYVILPFDGYAIVYHILRAFAFMLGLWALSKVLA